MKINVKSETLELYSSLLPYGSQKEIAQRAGVTVQSVSLFLSGKTRSKRVEDAVLDYITEISQNRQAKLRKAGLL